jgi:hypothetical protein
MSSRDYLQAALRVFIYDGEIMAKRLAWLLIAACLILTACTTTTKQKKEPSPATTAPQVKEQPKTEKPKTEQPKAEKPKAEKPKTEQAEKEQPKEITKDKEDKKENKKETKKESKKEKGKAKEQEKETDAEKEQEQQTAETGIKFTKIHVPLKEIKKENGHVTSSSVYTYGQDKLNPIKVEIYDIHNELIEQVVTEKIEVHTDRKRYLDKDNNIIRYYVINRNEDGKITEQLLFNGSNKLIAIEEYEYNEAGRTAEWRVYNGSKTLLSYNIYTYKNGRNIRVDSYNASGTLSEYFINEFDKNGNLICESAYDQDDNLLAQHRSTFRNGLIYREEFQGEDKKLQWYITYTYSEQYLKVLKTTYSGDGRELEQLEQSCILYDK